ncbi:hypothetical protein T459_25317 [Capsicum annuum]|uniref:Uncharacterized protein n=1 Tax=Capsicum annuum TaxID=4072 RepID=A0A2G2YKE5_CAPAN|nr:hypothetical protein T459_25317 [Capsicum annuum]
MILISSGKVLPGVPGVPGVPIFYLIYILLRSLHYHPIIQKMHIIIRSSTASVCYFMTPMSVVMVPDARLDSSYHQVADQVLSSLFEFSPADWGLPRFENASTKLY